MVDLSAVAREIAADSAERERECIERRVAVHEDQRALYPQWHQELATLPMETDESEDEAKKYIKRKALKTIYIKAWDLTLTLALFAFLFYGAVSHSFTSVDVFRGCLLWFTILGLGAAVVAPSVSDSDLRAYQVKPRKVPAYFAYRDRRRFLNQLIVEHQEFEKVVAAARQRLAASQSTTL